MRILPIGSVIKTDNMKLMVAGHFSKNENKKLQYYYVAVPYPVGYVGMEKVFTISVEAEVEVLHEGFQTEGGKNYTNKLESYAKLSPLELEIFKQVMSEAAKNMKGGK